MLWDLPDIYSIYLSAIDLIETLGFMGFCTKFLFCQFECFIPMNLYYLSTIWQVNKINQKNGHRNEKNETQNLYFPIGIEIHLIFYHINDNKFSLWIADFQYAIKIIAWMRKIKIKVATIQATILFCGR